MSDIRDEVREKYEAAARQVGEGGSCCSSDGSTPIDPESVSKFGAGLYDASELVDLPNAAKAASMGCGNPLMVAGLTSGERVVDLGSGGGIDVLLAAAKVGPTGFVYGVDMTPEMLELARANAERAEVSNVEFRLGTIEDVPLPDGSVDVVMSNCVINLSPDKPGVLTEAFRVLAPGGRFGVSDVVAEDDVAPEQRAERGSYVGCIAGALSREEYLRGLADAGFVSAEVTFTGEVAPGMHNATITAHKPEVES